MAFFFGKNSHPIALSPYAKWRQLQPARSRALAEPAPRIKPAPIQRETRRPMAVAMLTGASSEKRDTRPRNRSLIRGWVTPQWRLAFTFTCVHPRFFTMASICCMSSASRARRFAACSSKLRCDNVTGRRDLLRILASCCARCEFTFQRFGRAAQRYVPSCYVFDFEAVGSLRDA